MTNQIKLKWGWIILYPIGLRLLMIALTFPYVFIYSTFINSGEPAGFYEQYVFENRAYISTLLGLPVFYMACYRMGMKIKFNVKKNCLAMVGMYIIMDIPLELAVGDISDWRLLIAHSSKLIIGFLAAARVEKILIRNQKHA